jgi:hypothetical protein
MSNYDFLNLLEKALKERQYDWNELGTEEIAAGIEARKIKAPQVSKGKGKGKGKKLIKSKKEEDEIDVYDSSELKPKFTEKDDTDSLKNAHDFETFVELLNRFRAAGSLKDEDVNDELKVYFKLLSPGERQVIHVMIKGLTQIANLVKEGDTADIPSRSGINVSHAKSEKKKKSKNNKINTSDTTTSSKPDNKDSSKPAAGINPIQVESLQDKANIISYLNEIKKIK